MKRWAAFLLVCLVACGVRGAGNDGGVDGGNGLSSDEQGAYDGGSPGVNAIIALASAADAMFQFDPTIDPSQSDTQNANLVAAHVLSELGATNDAGAKCGSVTLNNTTVTAAFGPSPGCTLPNGTKISGTIAVGITKSASTITIALTMTAANVNGVALDGTVQLATTNGTTFTYSGNFTSGATTYSSTGLTFTGAAGVVTIDGAFSVVTDVATTYTFTALTWKVGDCYPNGGSLAIKTGLVTMSIAFDATTPTTGNVTVTVGKKSVTEKLPVYGTCT
jgi:hypothetical protein